MTEYKSDDFNHTNDDYARLVRIVALLTGCDRAMADALSNNYLQALIAIDQREGIPQ